MLCTNVVSVIDTEGVDHYPRAMTELALPAGSLQAALVAFSEGADAVYLGMKNFSARKGATNFTFEDLAKLRRVAMEQNKRIYVTVNTLVSDDQWEDLSRLLHQIDFIGCDGVIVQDLGLVNLIRQQFPNLKLHGSTQLAVHTIEGVKELERLGFERVVLARELTIEEIRRIRTACPDIQLKVFIHGALCYSFSGLCTASEQLCGRSANCGSCAQICRNYFTVSSDPSVPAALSPLGRGSKEGWFFSMSDLKAGVVAKELEEMGIESLKVEGRMKSPAYTALASRYYRAILEGREEHEELDEALSVVFSRRQTGGWLASYGREKQDFTVRKTPTLGSTSYPGHRGVKAGTVLLVRQGRAIVNLERDVSLRDGLMFFTKDTSEPVGTVKFGISSLFDEAHRSVTHAYASQTVEIPLPSGALPHAGEFLFLVSRHDQNPALLNETLPTSKHPLPMEITLTDESISISAHDEHATFPLVVSKAKKTQDVMENLRSIFSQSDTSYFTLGELTVQNHTSLPLEEIFLPLSVLKAIRRSWYEQLDKSLARALGENNLQTEMVEKLILEGLPARKLLTTKEGLPYLDLKLLLSNLKQGLPAKELLFASESQLYLPLSPVMFDEQAFFAQLEAIIAHLEAQGVLGSVRFGLNNLGQVEFFRNRGLACFFDIYLYLANHQAAQLALSLGLNLVGGYLWMERREGNFASWPFEPTIVEEAFHPPLFISRSCFRHDSLLLSCEDCPHRGSWYVKGDKNRYHVIVEDCITTVVHA
jgi:putative protease